MLNDFSFYVSALRVCAQCAGNSLCGESGSFNRSRRFFSLILGAELFCSSGAKTKFEAAGHEFVELQ